MFNQKYHRKIELLYQAGRLAEKDPGYLERRKKRENEEVFNAVEDEKDYISVRNRYFDLLKG